MSSTNFGGGIFNGGTISGNRAIKGGGIFVDGNGTVNLGAGGTINISGNISRYSSNQFKNNEMILEGEILGANTDDKISNGYIPFFANNIAYTNTPNGSPIKVIGNIIVEAGTKIGLSPAITTANAVIVEKGSSYTGRIDVDNFSFGTVSSGSNLTIDQYGTTTTGPGGGKVFFCNEARYEISNNIDNLMFWNAAANAIATYNGDNSVNGGKSDWFFPMIDMLGVANKSLTVLSGNCWSSSEHNDNNAWEQFFSGNNQDTSLKANTNRYVRGVRGF